MDLKSNALSILCGETRKKKFTKHKKNTTKDKGTKTQNLPTALKFTYKKETEKIQGRITFQHSIIKTGFRVEYITGPQFDNSSRWQVQ